MFIDGARVRGLGGKISRVGDDASSFLDRVLNPMESALSGNDGFVTMTALRNVSQALRANASQLADDSRNLGSNVSIAASRHEAVDAAQANTFHSFNPSEVH